MTTTIGNQQSEITTRVHEICKLLSQGLSVNEIAATVKFGHQDIKARKSFIVAVKAGRIHKSISENYDFNGYKTNFVEPLDTEAFWLNRNEILELIKQKKSNDTIAKMIYKEDAPYTFEQLVMFVSETRKGYIQRLRKERMSKEEYENRYGWNL